MAGKKPLGSLKPINTEKPKAKDTAETPAPLRGSVQTVRMDRKTLKALKDASFDRGISQNELMLMAIRKDLGL